jgi:DNA-binding MarR family transcriptional regulator
MKGKVMVKRRPKVGKMHFEESDRELHQHPGYLIRRLNQISVSIFLAAAKDFDLTHIQYATLTMADQNPGIDQSGLVRLLAIDRQTTSIVVKRLCEKGLLRKEPKDLRSDYLFLSGSGKAVVQAMRLRAPEVDHKMLSPLSAAEQVTFMELITKLTDGNNSLSRAPLGGVTSSASHPVKSKKALPKQHKKST